MEQTAPKLFPGDFVEVKSMPEILATLDRDGSLDKLPFMPEMAEYCGKRFRVSRRITKICTSGTGYSERVFRGNDVVFLDGLRCSGADHDGCQKACMIFWRQAWLRRVEDLPAPALATSQNAQPLCTRLKTRLDAETYFCQASQLLKAAAPLSKKGRLMNCFSDIPARNSSIPQMAQRLGTWFYWKIRRKLFGLYARGQSKSTPVESLNLQPGEWVEVKPIESIIPTLDERAQNRGLWFAPDMRLLCGKRTRVASRIDKIIVDGTGKMRTLHNTVHLEGSVCGCTQVAAFGGCSRCELAYWREIWLRRAAAPQES